MATTKKYLVALDDGHGMDTPGKRTPVFPEGSGLKSETGNYMHENEFNRAVVAKCKVHLERCGINVLLVAPTDADTPLQERTNLANSKGADIYVSVHANASTGTWGSAKGVETYHYPGSTKGKKLAEAIHKRLIGGTKQVDRGVKEANYHVLRETKMPACLIEAAFMDNLEEAKLLLSDAFRIECAEEIARGICDYLGVSYTEEAKTPNKTEQKEGDEKMVLSDYQWKMLGDAMKGFYDKGIITDKSWHEKAYSKSLTQSEIAWLMAIIAARNAGVNV